MREKKLRTLISVLRDEELIRIRHRLQKKHNTRLAEILTEELKKRDGIAKAEAEHG